MYSDNQTTKGIVFDIKTYALHDGPGIRTTVFLKGCPLSCRWCHNPESQQLKLENYIRLCRMADHEFKQEETVGKWMSTQEVMTVLEREQLFHDQSGGGVTFSGGEPLMQINFLEALLYAARELELHTCLDTSGFTTAEKFRKIIPLVNLFLYDLKLMNEERHIQYTSVSNQPILKNLEMLLKFQKPVIIRFPVIPTITDAEENIRLLKNWLLKNGSAIKKLDLLPYHHIGRGKYQRFEMVNKMPEIKEPDQTHISQLKNFFEETGVRVSIGG